MKAATLRQPSPEALNIRIRTERKVIRRKWVTITIKIPRKLLAALRAYRMEPMESLACLSAWKRMDGSYSHLGTEIPASRWRSQRYGHCMQKGSYRWSKDTNTRAIEVEMPEDLWREIQWCAEGAGVSVTAWAMGCFSYRASLKGG